MNFKSMDSKTDSRGAYIEHRLKLKLPMFDSWIVPPSIAIEKRGILRDSVITAAFLIFSLW